MEDLSPFVIEKCIQSIVGNPKTIRKLKSGDLLLEVDRQQQVENLLKTTKIFDLKDKISLHQSLNSSKGVIRCPELRPCSDKESIDNLTDQGVTGVRNIRKAVYSNQQRHTFRHSIRRYCRRKSRLLFFQ